MRLFSIITNSSNTDAFVWWLAPTYQPKASVLDDLSSFHWLCMYLCPFQNLLSSAWTQLQISRFPNVRPKKHQNQPRQSNNRVTCVQNITWTVSDSSVSITHQPRALNVLFKSAAFICLFAKLPRPVFMCRGHRAYRRMMVTMRLWDVLLWKASQRGLVVLPPLPPPPSAPIPLLLTMLHIINQLWVGLPCKYPNESSFIKWLNGPDKSPNEEINNSVIVTLLILIRPSCSALIPAKRRSFFTVFSSACQHCCRFFFFLFSVLEASWWIVRCCRCFLERWKGFCDLWDALTLL